MKLVKLNYSDSLSASPESVGDWEEIPVSPREFFDKFIDEPLFPKQQEFVDACIGEDPLVWDDKFQEGIALWGKGSGKDKTAAKIMLYVVYKLLCMKDPYKMLGLGGTGDKIEVGNVCINAKLAKAVFFKYFVNLVKKTINPKTKKNWFYERGLNSKKDIHKRDIEFPKNITAYSLDSKEYTGEGLNLLLIIYDEIAGFEVTKAKDLYDALKTTARSRFPKHMKILLLSYKRADTDFMITRFKQAEFEPSTFRSGPYATWDVNPRRTKEDFVSDYIADAQTAERIYECKGDTSEGGYFPYRTRISQVINSSNRINPVIEDKTNVIDLRTLAFKDFFKPEIAASYYMHVDLAKGGKGNDACGLALGHFKRGMMVKMPDDFIKALSQETGLTEEAIRLQQGIKKVGAIIDLVLQLKAPPGGEIMFEEVRAFIERLRRIEKFPIQMVTYDGWQSIDSIQQLRRAGVNAQEQSVDKDLKAYDTLKRTINEGIFECYFHKTLVRELCELQLIDGKKVDHPVVSPDRALYEDNINKGSKDVADAVAGCVRLCIEHGKSEFKFWSGSFQPPTDPMRQPVKYEAEKLIRYGESPPPWYKKK
jgi:hypothetical protein